MNLKVALVVLADLAFACSARAAVDFNREIRPILNAKCVSCHGGVKKAGGISLQYREGALKEGESGAQAIVPGKPEESEVIARLVTEDKSDRMPKKEQPLTTAEIARIKQWIAEGAPWAQHWSLAPVVKPAVPAVPGVQPIDAFIRTRLAAEKLSPPPEAKRAALLRRLSLDLIGLPLTPDDAARFERNTAPNAYEQEVDRLLASPHFGERWAALWMDLARYSDTKGYEKDRSRPMWPYRDWLVNAFNADMPYDQFTIKQLAGDLLPHPTQDDLIATAMQRLTSTNEEGGTDREEFRTYAVLDRVNTTWQAWLGTSFGCAQCHDHPYDAFRNRDYYEAVAFFNNTADADRSDEAPTINVSNSREGNVKFSALDAEIGRLKAERDDLRKVVKTATHWQPLNISEVATGTGLSATSTNGEVHLEGHAPSVGITIVTGSMTGPTLGRVRLETLPQTDAPGHGAGSGSDGNFVLTGFEAAIVQADGREQKVEFAGVESDYEQNGYPAIHALKNPNPDDTGWAVSGAIDKPHFAIFRPVQAVAIAPGARLRVKLLHFHTKRGAYQGAFLAHFRLSVSPDGEDPKEARIRELEGLVKLKTRERDSIAMTPLPVMEELNANKSRKSYMFVRGNWLNKGDEVHPGTPTSLPAMPPGAPHNRLGLAEWIVSKESPLTPRVAVNRIWEQLFGIGLVETAEDFGTKGEAPSHPELLDWLAASFRDDFHWSMKRLIRTIVLSHAYRQDSRASDVLVQRDPRNRLLARGPHVRLTAEMVRDNALAVSGLLTDKLGGPSVMPPLPPGAIVPSPYNDNRWSDATGPDRYRRAIYTFWKRSNPYPSLITFDSAERSVCTSRRLSTDTPLQALVTLNDPVYVECAQALARRMRSEGGAVLDGEIARGWQLVTLSAPPPGVIVKLVALYRDSLAQFQKDSADAKHFAGTPEEAAMTNVASVLLNLDQTLTK